MPTRSSRYLLLLGSSAALVRRVPCHEIMLLPALYITWMTCRVIYIHGYIANGSGRMLGFPGTMLPAAAALGYSIWLAVQEGSLY
jgi:hypothetical protein